MRRLLEEGKFEFVEFKGIKPIPVLSRVYEGMDFVREYQPDFLLAVGGASVIDTMKAVSAGVMLPEGGGPVG